MLRTRLTGDVEAIPVAALSAALDEDSSGDTYRDVFWPYYERVSDSLDAATRAEGWELLGDAIDAFGPTADDELPLVSGSRKSPGSRESDESTPSSFDTIRC